jgi:hypothetical protein
MYTHPHGHEPGHFVVAAASVIYSTRGQPVPVRDGQAAAQCCVQMTVHIFIWRGPRPRPPFLHFGVFRALASEVAVSTVLS